MKGLLLRLAVPVLLLVLVLGGWAALYSSTNDPKNIRYVLWKAGLPTMDLDTATGTMVGDAKRDKLIIGKTEAELRTKFGYLRDPAAASPYLRNCYENSPWRGKKVLFIRTSPWMVVFEGDTAGNLVLIKGS